MRIDHPLDDVFSNPNNVLILRHLVLFPSPVLTGRGLAREIGMSHATCIRALNDLTDMGIITRRTIGRSSTYEIPRESVLYRDILKPIFRTEAGFTDKLIDTLAKGIKSKIVAAYLFGSVARGEATSHSDVDVMFVVGKPEETEPVEQALERNREDAYRLFRVGVNAVIYHRSEFDRMREKNHPFVMEVLRDGILKVGKEIR